MQQQIESHFHFHLSLHALRLKLTFASKSTKHAQGSITNEATAGNHIANEPIKIFEMVTVDHAHVSPIRT